MNLPSFIKNPPERVFEIIIMILLLPALFIHLGLVPFILDEATRATVALEMIFSGNYLVPTINGEFYYNKPPLFNWILVLSALITGNYSELTFRLPVVLSLLGFAATVFVTMRKELGREVAFITALALITCGRILFYDSFRGLIDISYSWITYTMFWSVYYFNRKGNLLLLFTVSWFLTSLGFLMKGLPSVVFQGITLLTFFIYTKQFVKLFSWKSFAGAGLFLIIAGGYFLLYNQYNSLENYWNALWSESAMRTPIDNPLLASVIHFFSFPAEFVMHFLPWTLLVIFIAGKGRIKELLREPAIKFFVLIFIPNIFIYWISPGIYPRYLFMFLPLFFGTCAFAWYHYGPGTFSDRYIWQVIMAVICLLVPLTFLVLPFTPLSGKYSHLWLRWLALLILSGFTAYLFFRLPQKRTYVFIMTLLIARVAFNAFVLPDRLQSGGYKYQKEGAVEAARITKGEDLYLYRDCPIQHASSFYISAEREEILKRWFDEPQAGVNYIMPLEDAMKKPELEIVHIFETRIENLKLAVVR